MIYKNQKIDEIEGVTIFEIPGTTYRYKYEEDSIVIAVSNLKEEELALLRNGVSEQEVESSDLSHMELIIAGTLDQMKFLARFLNGRIEECEAMERERKKNAIIKPLKN